MAALVAVETVLVAVLGLLVIGLLRSHADILRALHDAGLGLGDPADGSAARSILQPVAAPSRRPGQRRDSVQGVTPTGDAISFALTPTEHDTLLAFLSSGCLTCRDIWGALAGEAPATPPGTRVVAVTRGAHEESETSVATLAADLREVPVVLSSEAWDDFEVPVAPYFVLVNGSTGEIAGEGAAASWPQVLDLVGRATGDETRGRSADERLAHRNARERVAAWAVDRDREARADDELAAAGILPGDPRLHPTPPPDPS